MHEQLANLDPLKVSIPPLTLNTAQLARALGVCERTIRALSESGRLPRPIRWGRAVRWSTAEVSSWLIHGAPSREDWEQIWEAIKK